MIGFLDCKFDETYTPGTGPMMDEELVEVDLIKASVYSGHVN
jgi:hypothetical protein